MPGQVDPASGGPSDPAPGGLPRTGSTTVGVAPTVLRPAEPLDPLRVHYLEIPELNLRALVRRDPIFRTFDSTKPLGARVSPDGSTTTVRVFAPRAHAVRLFLYDDSDDAEPGAQVEMRKDGDGVWEASFDRDLHGAWYDFTVHGPEDPGNYFFETHPVHVSDPYALVQDDALGRSRVWRDGPAPPPLAGGRPAMEDVVAYEVHVQDFTDLLPSDQAGTLAAFAEPGLRNAQGEPIGFDYLAELGINVVHLMPVQEFFHYPDAAWRAVFADVPFAQQMAIDQEDYQWGYRTTHAFAVESRYRPRGSEPGAERDAFRTVVAAFHARGIAVIIDVVPNHTGENMDGRHDLLNFNVLDLPYYYRTSQTLEHIGPFGNEVKTEDRPMVQRWLLDQLRHWVESLGVDGFRMDLAGQIDKQTLLRVKAELPADLIIYGEPWIPPSDPDVRANSAWSWYKSDAPITFFQDDARNAFKGSPFHIHQRGWAGGDTTRRHATMRALANNYPEEPLSTAGISYLDIHDNWTLADRYALHPGHNGLDGVDLGAVRRAAGLLFTSVGPIVINGGTEMLRSKGLAPHAEFEREVDGGVVAFKGRQDTYNLRAPNRFLWDSLAPGSDARAMRDWWRGLARIRASEAGAVFRVADVPPGHYRWITPDDPHLLGYVVGERVLVLANNGGVDADVPVELPDGIWCQVTNEGEADPAGVGEARAELGGGRQTLTVPAGAFFMWVKE